MERKSGRFARRLLDEWKNRGWPTKGERLVVAVSGGADSTALLLACDELRRGGFFDLEFVAAHLDHGLRGEEAAADARWVEELSARLGYECVAGRVDVRAAAARDNLEQAARRARYAFLEEAARNRAAHAVLTAHTLDDQAETVLLRLLRGSGAEGLGGIRPERELAEGIWLRRPLLSWARRADTEGYCCERGSGFRMDAMNEDESFARVRVRRKLLPLLESINPRMAETLGRTAELLREDAAALDAFAATLLKEATERESVWTKERGPETCEMESQGDLKGSAADAGEGRAGGFEESPSAPASLRVEVLRAASPSVRRRALRAWLAEGRGDLRRLEMSHVLAVEKLLMGERGGRVVELPGGARVERRRGLLRFQPADNNPRND